MVPIKKRPNLPEFRLRLEYAGGRLTKDESLFTSFCTRLQKEMVIKIRRGFEHSFTYLT